MGRSLVNWINLTWNNVVLKHGIPQSSDSQPQMGSSEVIQCQGPGGSNHGRCLSPVPSPAVPLPCPGCLWPHNCPLLCSPAHTHGWYPGCIGRPLARKPLCRLPDIKYVIIRAWPYLAWTALAAPCKGDSRVDAKPTLTHGVLQPKVQHGHWWFKATDQAVDCLYGGGNHFQENGW